MKKSCEIIGCDSKVLAKKLCSTHYQRLYRIGDPNAITIFSKSSTDLKGIEQHLLKNRHIDNNGCWNWTRGKIKDGYGHIKVDGKTHKVHRISAMIFLNFELTSGLCVCHQCDNPSCFNPKHLFIGTHQDNYDDMFVKGRARTRKGFYPSSPK